MRRAVRNPRLGVTKRPHDRAREARARGAFMRMRGNATQAIALASGRSRWVLGIQPRHRNAGYQVGREPQGNEATTERQVVDGWARPQRIPVRFVICGLPVTTTTVREPVIRRVGYTLFD